MAKSFEVLNPITEQTLYTISDTSTSDVQKVFQNVRAAQQVIAQKSIDWRIKEIYKIRDYIKANREEITNKIIEETGKARFDALTSEIFEIIDVIDVITKKVKKVLKDEKVSTPLVLLGKSSKVIYEPLGIVLIITPWNYPLYQALIPSFYAFLSGNAAVVKPSELTPLKGLIEEILTASGFMQDAIQVVYGGRETGKALIDAKPNKIHFTGSTRAGKEIMKQAAEHLIPVDLELGGKDPSIVFDDVNLSRTVNGVMWGAFTTAGQSCTSIERLYVHENIYDVFVNDIVARTKRLRTPEAKTDITQPDAYDIGCMTSPAQIKIIEAHLADATEKGAKILCGGTTKQSLQNCFLPTVVTGVNHSMKIMQEETFGPVLPIMKFKTEQQVIELANDSEYGLGASVWSKDLKRADRIARALVCGNVSINNHMITEANPNLPFGGVKQSGIGRYKGKWGLHTFSNIKSIVTDKQGSIIDPHWYPFTKEKYKMINTVLDHLIGGKLNIFKVLPAALKLDSIGKQQQIKGTQDV